MRRAASRADWTAGSNSAIRTAMMAMTTSSSIKVKPRGRVDADMEDSSWVHAAACAELDADASGRRRPDVIRPGPRPDPDPPKRALSPPRLGSRGPSALLGGTAPPGWNEGLVHPQGRPD